MKPYADYTRSERCAEYAALQEQYDAWKAKKLSLNMARGKPSRTQLDMVSGILTVLQSPEDCFDGALDVRNYGELTGIPSAKRLFAELLGVTPSQVLVGGSASLNLMYDLIAKAWTHGLLHSPRPWSQEPVVRFLCPAPGYDRHFRVSQSFGMELIPIAMTPDGPDMDAVEAAVRDPAVKGIWCVPKYSNPQGIVYSDAVVDRLAALRPAAPDFALMWDNAYCLHEVYGQFVPFRDMLTLCREAGNADMVYEFASTSKITFPGAGVAVMAASEANLKYLSGLLGAQTISYDKVNQLRHVRFLQDKAHVLELMQRHAAILRPKFEAVLGSPARYRPARHRELDGAEGRLLCLMRRHARYGEAHARSVRRGRCDHDARRSNLSRRERPRRQQHPHRAELPARGGAGAGHADLLPRPAHGRFGKARALIITAAPHNYIFGLSRIFFAECSC